MATDAHAASAFYASRQGVVVARLLRERLALLWPSLARQSVLGIGFAQPYLDLWRHDAARCVALVPAQVTTAPWPEDGPSLTCSAEEDALPFPDLSFDRILLMHGLEAAENGRRLLREAWRVLRDDGRLLIVAPNRRGMWAHVDSTPFGQGQPYSTGQIGRLLAAGLFRVERRDTALYLPPADLKPLLGAAPVWERTGRRLAPHLAGVTITEAVKDVYAAMPLTAPKRRRVMLAEAA